MECVSVQRNTLQEFLGVRNSGPITEVVPLSEVASEWNVVSVQSNTPQEFLGVGNGGPITEVVLLLIVFVFHCGV